MGSMVCFEGCYFKVDVPRCSLIVQSWILQLCIKEIQLGKKPGLGTNTVMESLMEASQDECEIVSDVLPLFINSFNDFKVHNFNTGYRYQSTSQRHFRSSLWAIGTHPWRQSAQWRLPANWPCNSGPFPEKVVVSCCIRTIQRREGFWTILHFYNVYLGFPTIVIYHIHE